MSTGAQGGVDLHAEQEIDLRSAWTRISGALVDPDPGARARRGPRRGVRGRRRRRLRREGAPLHGPAVHAGGRRSAPEPADQPPHGDGGRSRSEASLDAAAEASGLTRAQLRGNVTSAPVTIAQGATARNLSPLIEIRVKAPTRDAAEAAAVSLSESVIEAVRGYTDEKVTLLEREIAVSADGLARVERRLERAYAQQEAIATRTTFPPPSVSSSSRASTRRSRPPRRSGSPCRRTSTTRGSSSGWRTRSSAPR